MTWLAAILLFVLWTMGSGFWIASAMKRSALVSAVNRRLPKDQQFELSGWWPAKYVRFDHAFRQLAPDPELKALRSMVWMLAGVAVCFHLGGLPLAIWLFKQASP